MSFTSITSTLASSIMKHLIDSVSLQAVVIDEQGDIVYANENWNQFYQNLLASDNKVDENGNYFEYCRQAILQGDDYALRRLLGLYSVLQGKQEQFSLTYPLNSANQQRWYKLTVLPGDNEFTGLFLFQEDITQKKLQEQALRESEERYRRQFKHSLDGILITRTSGQIIDANPEACNILGWGKDQLLELGRDDIVFTDDPSYQAAMRERKDSGRYKAEFRMKKSNGEPIYVEAVSKTYRADNGDIQAILNFRDVTKRKKITDELNNQKKFNEALVQSIPGTFFVLDEDLKIIRWNEALIQNFGYSEKELSGMSALELIHPDDHAIAESAIAHIWTNGYAEVELRTITKQDEIRHLTYKGNKLEEQGQCYIVGAAVDITEQKKMEIKNKQQQAMVDQLFDNSPLGIVMVDKNHEILRSNKSFTDIFGYTQEAAIGQNIDNLLISDSMKDEAAEFKRQGFEGNSFQVDTVRQAKDGTLLPVLIGGVPIVIEDEIIAMYGMYADISERKKLEEQIIQSLEEKEILIREIHHRVKNNLAFVDSMIQLQLADTEEQHETAALYSTQSRILTIAKIQELMYQNSDLTNIPFHKYLEDVLESHTIFQGIKGRSFNTEFKLAPLNLNINQAIPFALLINEIVAKARQHLNTGKVPVLTFKLSRKKQQALFELDYSDAKLTTPLLLDETKTVHDTLIQTLVQQLNATIKCDACSKHQNRITISFALSNQSGSASMIH